MTVRRVIAALVAVAVLAGCAPESGTVTGRSTVFLNKVPKTRICVKSGGETGCSTFNLGSYAGCSKGSKWPDCKAGQ